MFSQCNSDVVNKILLMRQNCYSWQKGSRRFKIRAASFLFPLLPANLVA